MLIRELLFLFYTYILNYDYTMDKAKVFTSKEGDILSFSTDKFYKVMKVDKKSQILYIKKVLK